VYVDDYGDEWKGCSSDKLQSSFRLYWKEKSTRTSLALARGGSAAIVVLLNLGRGLGGGLEGEGGVLVVVRMVGVLVAVGVVVVYGAEVVGRGSPLFAHGWPERRRQVVGGTEQTDPRGEPAGSDSKASLPYPVRGSSSFGIT
jgi:hypothetical protein